MKSNAAEAPCLQISEPHAPSSLSNSRNSLALHGVSYLSLYTLSDRNQRKKIEGNKTKSSVHNTGPPSLSINSPQPRVWRPTILFDSRLAMPSQYPHVVHKPPDEVLILASLPVHQKLALPAHFFRGDFDFEFMLLLRLGGCLSFIFR